ncbi:hypothetical protein [Nocardia aurantiaca]|uniref:hypothetical protein n=1 Tax=Nocardia aurantiaca TaxID=2675850 RepID=UPI0012B77100|nr:hypothetical protein [Nocardia aurantiaca]
MEAEITRELARLLAPTWKRLDAAFAFTVSDEAAQVILSDNQRAVPARPSARVVELLREHRHRSAGVGDGPWWRFLVSLTNTGEATIDYDDGSDPFPDDHLFPAAAYQADLQTYPRRTLPVWLAAYVGHQGRQVRTPKMAFTQAQADFAAGVTAISTAAVLPPFPLMWARWAAISAAFVAANSQWGPRITAGVGWFEGSKRSGATLHRLPGGRAVLSGGVWNAAELDAAYNRGAALPLLYRGAPDWVADPVLSPRAANGLLSFCYWWDGNAWYQGESPDPTAVGIALPGIWTSKITAEMITQALGTKGNVGISNLVSAAETHQVTRPLLMRGLGGDAFETHDAYYQLVLAGVASSVSAQSD